MWKLRVPELPLNVEKATHYCKSKMHFVSRTGWLEMSKRSFWTTPRALPKFENIFERLYQQKLPKTTGADWELKRGNPQTTHRTKLTAPNLKKAPIKPHKTWKPGRAHNGSWLVLPDCWLFIDFEDITGQHEAMVMLLNYLIWLKTSFEEVYQAL